MKQPAPAHPELYADLLVGLTPEEAEAVMVDVRARLNLGERRKRVLLIVHRINPLEDFDVPEQQILRGVGRDALRSIKSGKRVTLK